MMKFPIEKEMQKWFELHGLEFSGRHWKADIHRRFWREVSKHICSTLCKERYERDTLKRKSNSNKTVKA